ncbi:MAG: HAD-superfamily hydrolase, subfamily variant 3 [Glaciihabitans sp.]|nr:HAD-superfamily hydrolase, subfamily variant 3 [Glaciihabitans sp.]
MTNSASPTLDHPVIGRVFSAILFDMDGTLIDSTPAVERSWAKWGAERGLAPDFRNGVHGQPASQIVASLVPADQFAAASQRILDIEVAEVADIVVLAGAADALASIPQPRKAIVTSCSRPLASARITASGLVAPAVVITFDDVTHGKPDPEPFVRGAEALGFDPRECLVVEDAVAGLASGRAAGCATLGIVGTHAASELDADYLVTTLAELAFTPTAEGILVTLAG